MAVHYDPKNAADWKIQQIKAGKKINADTYPPGGLLPEKPVTARGKRRAALRNQK